MEKTDEAAARCIQDANNPLEIPLKMVLEVHSVGQQKPLISTNSYRTLQCRRLEPFRQVIQAFGLQKECKLARKAGGISVVSKQCVFGWHWR